MKNVDLIDKVVLKGSGGTIDPDLSNTYTLMPSWKKYNSEYIVYSYDTDFHSGVICKESYHSPLRSEAEKNFKAETSTGLGAILWHDGNLVDYGPLVSGA